MRHTLPSGGWVEFRELDTLRGKDSKAVTRQIDPENPMESALSVTDELIVLMVTAWEFPYPAPDGNSVWPLPSTTPMHMRTLTDEMTAADYTRLQQLVDPVRKLLMPKAPSPDDYDQPGSPTVPASA
jgi:hypothetical protein